MKQLTCEMCGSTEMMKQEGVFVCQTCGTKYTVEEAKKMMIEGTVEVTGTVKIDKSSRINNMLENAVNEFNLANNDKVIALCSEILNEDPSNYRAIIYKGLATGWKSSVADCNMTMAVSELSRAIGKLREQETDDKIFTELCKEPIIELQKLGTAVLRMYGNYYNEYKNNIKEREKEHERLYTGVSDKRHLYKIKEDLACELGEAFYKHKKGQISAGTGLNSFIIDVFNFIEDPIKVCNGFYNLIEDYVSSYSEYIYDENREQYSKIVTHCENLKKQYDDFIKMQFFKEKPEIFSKHVQLLAESEELKKKSEEYLNKAKHCLELVKKVRAKLDEKFECEEMSKKESIIKEIDALLKEKANLGLFKGNAKKALQLRIDEKNTELERLKDIISEKLNKRNEDINNEEFELKEKANKILEEGRTFLDEAQKKEEEAEALLTYKN